MINYKSFPTIESFGDLNSLTPKELLGKLTPHFELQVTAQPGEPPAAGFDMYLKGQWHRATPKHDPSLNSQQDPVRVLAVSELTERVLDPLLGIKDQRSDPRIDFCGRDSRHPTTCSIGRQWRLGCCLLVVPDNR